MIRGSPNTPAVGSNGIAFLDLFRALAANLVLLGHASAVFGFDGRLASAGTIGVTIFFTLSGFLIMQSSLSRLHKPRPHFEAYMLDRIARIFTAYIPALFLVAAVNAIMPLGQWAQPGTSTGPLAFVGNLLLLQDYPLFQIARRTVGQVLFIRSYNAAEPFWTIPIEFWIYVVFGLSFFGLFSRERIPPLLSLVLCLVALPVVIWNAAAGGGNGLTLVWLVGAASGYVWTSAWARSSHKLEIGLAIIAFAGVCLVGRGAKFNWNFQDLGQAICLAMVILGGLSALEGIGRLPRVLRSACTFLASYSYSLYLVHNTVLIVVKETLSDRLGVGAPAVALLAAHGVAFVVYLAFEQHYRLVGLWLKRNLLALHRLGAAPALAENPLVTMKIPDDQPG